MPSPSNKHYWKSNPRSTTAPIGGGVHSLTTPHAREFARAIACLRGFLGEHITPDNYEVFLELAFLHRRRHWHPLFHELASRARASFPTPLRLPSNITDTTAADLTLDHLITHF